MRNKKTFMCEYHLSQEDYFYKLNWIIINKGLYKESSKDRYWWIARNFLDQLLNVSQNMNAETYKENEQKLFDALMSIQKLGEISAWLSTMT